MTFRLDRRELWALVGLTLLAAAFRAADLTGRSAWLDDAATLLRLASSWRDNLLNIVYLYDIPTIDTHPPLYFLLLKAWTGVLGGGELSIKWVSVMGGTLVVPLTYALARRAAGGLAAMLAALFVTLSPAIEWYSHDLRMYTLVVCLAALSTYWLCRAARPRGRASAGAWIAWGAALLAAVFTHYSFVGLAAAHALFVALLLIRRLPGMTRRARRRVWASVLAVLAVIAVSIGLAWPVISLSLARLASGREADYNFVPLDVIAQSLVSGQVFGMNAADPSGGWLTWLVAGLCALGVVLPLDGGSADRRSRGARLLLALSVGGPILVWFAISFIKPNFQGVRHLILVLPILAVLLGRALSLPFARADGRPARLAWRAASIAALAGVLGLQVFGNLQQFVRTSNWHDDWRGMAAYMRNHWLEGDILVCASPLECATLALYAPELKQANPPGQEEVARHRRVWLSSTSLSPMHPGDVTYDWFLERGYQRQRIAFPARTRVIDLTLFELHSPLSDAAPAAAHLTAAPAGSAHAAIAAFELKPGSRLNPQPNLWLSLYWTRGSEQDVSNYSVSARFTGRDGQVWADWFVPAGLEAAPPGWAGATLFRSDHQIPLPLGLPDHTYQLELTARAGAKPEVVQSISAPLRPEEAACCVRIVDWPAASASSDVWSGAQVALAKVEYPPVVKPGEIMPVVLTWKLNQPGLGPWQTALSLDGLFSGNVATSTAQTGAGEFPAGAWPLGQPVRDAKSMRLPFSARPGWYRLTLQRSAPDVAPDGPVFLGWVEVRDYPRTPVAQEVAQRVEATVGDLDLLGYSMGQPFTRSLPLEFHTYWRVNADPTRDGVLFLHLIAPDGKLAAQDDSPPEQGQRSTLTYRVGDGIDQVHRLVLPPNAPGGEYRVYAGVYNRGDMARWPAAVDGAPAQDDLAYLGSLRLPPLRATYVPLAGTE